MLTRKKKVKRRSTSVMMANSSSALRVFLIILMTFYYIAQIMIVDTEAKVEMKLRLTASTSVTSTDLKNESSSDTNVTLTNSSNHERRIHDNHVEWLNDDQQQLPGSSLQITSVSSKLIHVDPISPPTLQPSNLAQDSTKMFESNISSEDAPIPPKQRLGDYNTRIFEKSSSQPKVTAQQSITTMTTAMPSTTITTAPTITHGSHYQILVGSESKNLVKLETISSGSKDGLDKVASRANSGLQEYQNRSTPSSAVDDYNGGHQLETLEKTTSEGQDSEKSTQQQQQQQQRRRSLRWSPGETHPSSLQERAATTVASSSNIVRAVLGQRLVIPCSNLSSSSSSGESSLSSQQQQQMSSRRVNSNQRFRTTGGNSQKQQPPQVANGQGISLIVWHKDEQLNSPIFAVDARGASSLREAKQQTGSESLKGRVHLEESTRLDSRGQGSTPALVIDEAEPHDSGVYTCTIEFYKMPTQMHVARVELINPPKNILIRDDSNKVLPPNGLTGPHEEDTRLRLTCQVEPGDPPAQLSWWQLDSISPLLATNGAAASGSAVAASSNPHVSLVSANFAHQTADANDLPVHNYMTTMTLGAAVGDAAELRDYLVSVHSNQAPVSRQHLVLPFSSGHSLRHWRRVITDQTSSSSGEHVQSTIQLSLSRENLGDEYMCCAWNSQYASMLNTSVKVDLNLKPESVQIVNKSNQTLKVGQQAMIECHVQGSKPGAKVRWFRGSQELETASVLSAPQNSEYELNQNYISEFNRDTYNLTKISYLTLVPQLSDNQQSLTCSASNPKLPNATPLKDTIIMSVQFPARLNLQLGANIKADSIQTGHDIILECNVQSNPPINDLIWLFNGQTLANNISAGVIISNQTLVLQHVTIEQRGQYQCAAQNTMGKSFSNKFDLKPKFAPVCDYTLTRTRYEVNVNQPMKIECHVLAEPDDDIHFIWQFNQTSSAIDRKGLDLLDYRLDDIKQYETNFTRSHVIFTPKTKHNYGQLLCSASNSRGKQEKPCVIQVSPSELPDPVFACWFENLTESSFSIHCQTPHGNSTSHNYLLELYTNNKSSSLSTSGDSQNPPDSNASFSSSTHLKQREEGQNEPIDNHERLLSNEQQQQQQVDRLESADPAFNLTNLKPDTSYNILIYVQNSKGRSAPASYQTSTLPIGKTSELLPAGHVHLSSKRLAMESSFVDKVSAFLKLDEYASVDRSKLVIVVVLILILSTIAVIAVTISILRQCRRPITTRQKHKRNKRNSLDSTQTKLSAYDKRTPQMDTTVRLTPADSARMKGLAGSGSDTSRETNTDSTLLPSSRTGVELSNDHQPATNARLERSESITRFTNGPLMSTAVTPFNGQKHYLNSNNPSPLLVSLNKSSIDQKLQNVYSNINRQQQANCNGQANNEIELSHTPQVSMKSESDCTSNREVQSAVEESNAHNQILIKCQDNLSEPVYVISRKGLLTSQCVTPQQIRLIDPTNFWPQRDSIDNHTNNGSISAGTQVSSLGTSDSFDRTNSTAIANTYNLGHCQVLNANTGLQQSNSQLGPVSYLPGSMSIPVSLSSCMHPREYTNQHHRLSHDLLNGDVCIASANGSFLTLTPDGQASYQHEILTNQQPQLANFSYPIHQEQQLAAEISPPASFATDPTNYRGSVNINESAQSHYCAQTLEHPYRNPRKLNGCANRTNESRRGSYDDNIVPMSYATQPHKHHVRFDPQNILYDSMTMRSVMNNDAQMVDKEDMDQY